MHQLQKNYCFIYSLLSCGLAVFLTFSAHAQCPPNIGFEEGSFNFWKPHTGRIDSTGDVDVTSSPPLDGRHTLLQKTNKAELDFYGQFPVNCPNGSGYSIKIGNDHVGAEAEGVSYTYVVPAGQNIFSLIYNYAVVFQDPGHLLHEQPRFTAKVFDVTDGRYISCSSFDFAASGDLPGFMNAFGDVLYKPWSPVTIKLMGYGGKTIRLEFTTNDCTKGGHFGYAYLDIGENCTSPIQGNIVCLNSNAVNLAGPYGYREYRWYDSAFTITQGTSNTLNISPAPEPGTKYALVVFPYPGSGCIDTLYTTIATVPVELNFALVPIIETCIPSTVDIQDAKLRHGSSPGLTYTYFTDSSLKEYLINPSAIKKDGTYYIKAVNGYGCKQSRSIKVIIHEQPGFNVVGTVKAFWPNTVDITSNTILSGNLQGLIFSYWQDKAATISLPQPKSIAKAGIYFIKAINAFGCSDVRSVNVLITPPPPPNVFSPNRDGINDVWQITGLQPYPNCTVDVFNRWGQSIFYSTGYKKPWDGTTNGSILPTDTYYYVIHLSVEAGSMKGSVTLIR